jgi:deazaflavin-dependent oxidoreductase (nitroreductase family)
MSALVRRATVAVLRSPFTGLLDGAVLVLTVRGRRTGRSYEVPVQYAVGDGCLWVLPGGHEHKTWWRNLTVEAPVSVRLRGRVVAGAARVVDGRAEPVPAADGLRAYLRRFPALARRWNVAADDALAELARSAVLVRVVPDDVAVLPAAQVREPGLRAAVRRHPLASFYLLTFLLSWGFWVPDALAGGHVTHTPGLLGPAAAALVVTALADGAGGLRELGARAVRWRVPLRWYVASALPLAVAVATAAAVALGPGDLPEWRDWLRMDGFADVGLWVLPLVLVVNAYGEETGWRGFALPRFRRRHGELEASLLVAVPWALWHLPAFFLDTGYRGFPLLLIPGFLLGLLAGAVVLTWLYEASGASLLVVGLWHLSLNLGSATAAGEGAPSIAVTALVIFWAVRLARFWQERDARVAVP